MKRIFLLLALVYSVVVTTGPALADFYVIAGGSVGTKINSVPYTISTPGFYYLDRNLTSTGNGIIVSSSNVTIDLMGFTITGPSGGGNYGISTEGTQEINNVEIRNGTITKFLTGIYSTVSKNFRVINVRAIGNFMYGINLGGLGHMVKGCTISDNRDRGIRTCNSSLVVHNVVFNNAINFDSVTGQIIENFAP